MLGHKLLQVLGERFDVWATVRKNKGKIEKLRSINSTKIFENIEADKFDSIEHIIKSVEPEVIINAVGIVKQHQKISANEFIQINSEFPHKLAGLANQYKSRLICISTDCVFDGLKGNYTEEDEPNALDIYGKSKISGEINQKNCLTIRTSIIGREIGSAHGLVEWFLENEKGTIEGFKNALFSGLPTVILAEILAVIIEDFPKLQGIYHISADPINKFELLNLVKLSFGSETEIIPSEDFQINRSLNSEKFRSETGIEIPDWKVLVTKMFEDSIRNKHIYE